MEHLGKQLQTIFHNKITQEIDQWIPVTNNHVSNVFGPNPYSARKLTWQWTITI